MSFRQTYKGVFQFKDQETLIRAMDENQAEASGADAMGLQESFRSESVMVVDIDAMANLQDWDEMAVAMATLALHASHGFLYAVAFNPEDGQKATVEYYEAQNAFPRPLPANTPEAPAIGNDYFPLVEGSTYDYVAKGVGHQSRHYVVRQVEVNGRKYFYLENKDGNGLHYNEALGSAYFYKENSHLFTVAAANEKELHALELDHFRMVKLVYNNASKVGDIFYAIWNEGNYFSSYSRLENMNITVPAGKFENCMRVQVDTYHVEEESMRHETYTQYFAKGVGLVKFEKGGVALELSAYHVGA